MSSMISSVDLTQRSEVSSLSKLKHKKKTHTHPLYTILKQLKTKDNEKILKVAREMKHYIKHMK